MGEFYTLKDDFLDDLDYFDYDFLFEYLDWFEDWNEYFGAVPTHDNLTQNIINGFFVIICILGLVGNGRIIYLLAFSIKRTSFSIYILNLSIADFGVLASFIMTAIFVAVLTMYKQSNLLFIFFLLFFEFFSFTHSASQFLLTAISLDRCVAVLFPLWYHYHRPPYLPTLVCGLIWILSFLLSAVHFILHQTSSSGSLPLLYQLAANSLLCTPFMVASSVTLWIHTRSKLQCSQRKLLTTVFLTLLFFLLFCLPMNAFYLLECFSSFHPLFITIGMGCATLNSSINPLLYFLVGRKETGKEQPKATLTTALQRVFSDEQERPEDQETREGSQL